MEQYLPLAGLSIVMGLTLILPFSVKKVEEELEIFLCIMGVAAVTISGVWSWHLIKDALKEPLMITAAVTVLGFIFRAVRHKLKMWIDKLISLLGVRKAIFFIALALGFGSSFITAIVAALILSEIVSILGFNREYEIRLVVYTCFAIGLGAVMTPIGEPLATIAVANLKGPPHYADFFYLMKKLGLWVAPGVLVSAYFACQGAGKAERGADSLKEDSHENNFTILLRSGKIYVFVMALIFLGAGLRPLADRVITVLPDWALYWVNTLSAILDNATLAAAEITPAMSERQIVFVLTGLLISGGMLIPGNIPNIISAAKLKIKSREWAAVALPYGGIMMGVYFIMLELLL